MTELELLTEIVKLVTERDQINKITELVSPLTAVDNTSVLTINICQKDTYFTVDVNQEYNHWRVDSLDYHFDLLDTLINSHVQSIIDDIVNNVLNGNTALEIAANEELKKANELQVDLDHIRAAFTSIPIASIENLDFKATMIGSEIFSFDFWLNGAEDQKVTIESKDVWVGVVNKIFDDLLPSYSAASQAEYDLIKPQLTTIWNGN